MNLTVKPHALSWVMCIGACFDRIQQGVDKSGHPWWSLILWVVLVSVGSVAIVALMEWRQRFDDEWGAGQ